MNRVRILILPLFVICLSRAASQQKDVQIVSVSPMGSTTASDQVQSISVCFNQSMVPLDHDQGGGERGPLILEPLVKGRFRWISTTALIFTPDSPLRNASRYKVRIPAGTRSLGGAVLRKEFEWTFDTPRPTLIDHQPKNQKQFADLHQAILLAFSQQVNPLEAARSISIEERVGNSIRYPKFTARRAENKDVESLNAKIAPNQCVMLIPSESLLFQTTYTVRCKKELKCAEGALGTVGEYIFTFTTYAEFSLQGVVNPDRFPPTNSLQLKFSTPVSIAELHDHLEFTPPIKTRDRGYDFRSDHLYLDLPLRPETEYKGVLSKGLKDEFGQELHGERSFTFRTGPFTPFVRMLTGASVIESHESHRYPVRLMNVDSILVQMLRVDPDRIVKLLKELDYETDKALAWNEAIERWCDQLGNDSDAVVSSQLWQLHLNRNREVVKPIDLNHVLNGKSSGLVLLQVDDLFPTKERRHLRALLQVTDIGITSKISPENILIWVTHLRDASPAAGATVEFYDVKSNLLWQGQANAEGLAMSPGLTEVMKSQNRDGPYTILVHDGKDVAFSRSDWNDGIEPWNFDFSYESSGSSGTMVSSLFTDRGLYKVGERVDIKGIVHVLQKGEWGIPTRSRFKLVIHDPREKEIYSKEQELSSFGSFAVSLNLEDASPLGIYSMSLLARTQENTDGGWQQLRGGEFRIQAFRPAEFQVTAQFTKDHYVVGDSVTSFLEAHYLFGAPMNGENVTWRLSVSDLDWQPKGYDKYFFGPLNWLSRYSHGVSYRILASGKGSLSERGMIQEQHRLGVGEIRHTVSLLLEGDVASPSRQVISGRASTIVHAGEYYVGVAPSTTFLALGSPLTYNIVTVSPTGELLSGNSVDVRIFRRIWRSTRKAQTEGLYGWVSEHEDIPVGSAELISAGNAVEGRFTPTDAGFYFAEARSRDARGNQLVTQAYFYVSGSGYVPWERTDEDKIDLVLSKENFTPGEQASVIVKSPYEKTMALVTIEREGILDRFVTQLVGSAPQLKIPIKSRYLPNVYLSVVLVEGRTLPPGTSKESDIGRPSFKIGYVKIPVSPKEKQLTLRLKSDKGTYHPGDSVHVEISVSNSLGRGVPAEVTLSVADLGILNLIGYHLPDWFSDYYYERGLDVMTAETRLHLIEQRQYGEKGGEPGGGGGEDEELAVLNSEGTRKDFRPSAYWNPSIITDSNGLAIIHFRLPANLTKFRMMGCAQTLDADFGFAEESFTVNKPLMLIMSLPRFARVGDSFEGGVTLVNCTLDDKTVRLIGRASGISMAGSDTSRHTVKAGQALEVRRPLIARRAGKANFVFNASTDESSDGIEWSIPILAPVMSETVALAGSIVESRTQVQLVVPKDIARSQGGLELTAASTQLVNLSGGMSYLFSYPYGCLEQRISAILPILLSKDLVDAFNFEVFKDKDTRNTVLATLADLESFQRSNGGFAYWPNVEQTHPYVSAYAMYAAIVARQHAYPVDKELIGRGLAYLKRVLRGEEKAWYDTPQTIKCTNALILYTLALAGEPDYGSMERMYGDAKKSMMAYGWLPMFAESYLLKALNASKGNPAMIHDLTREILNHIKIAPTTAHFEESNTDGMEWIFHSTTRTTALALQALVETQPENPLMPKVVRWLLDNERSGAWRTTQENLYVVDALSTYFRVYEKDEPEFKTQISLLGKNLLSQVFKGRSLQTTLKQVPMSDFTPGLNYPVRITKAGKGRLYYGIRMKYYPMVQGTIKEEGMSVMKTIQTRGISSKVAERFSAGMVLRVSLTFTTEQDRSYVVIDDPLPAGFETIEQSFETTGTNLAREEELEKTRSGESSFGFDYSEMRDDRVVLFAYRIPAGVHTFSYLVRLTSKGDFQMPPTKIEQMYEPEVFGHTATRKIKID